MHPSTTVLDLVRQRQRDMEVTYVRELDAARVKYTEIERRLANLRVLLASN